MRQDNEKVEQRDLVRAFHLLGEINTSVLQVNQLTDNMLVCMRNGAISTEMGLSFLEMKYQMLLSYLINLNYMVLRKCSGEYIDGSTSIDRLIEIRIVLEKIRPIDHKLKYQINKLVKTAVTGINDINDPSKFKANPNALVTKLDSFDEATSSEEDNEQKCEKPKQSRKYNVYVPPKLAFVPYDGDETTTEKIRKAEEQARKRAVSRAVLKELKEEYLDAPVEDVQNLNQSHLNQGHESKQKIEYEEYYMTRLPITKQERHRLRHMTTLGTLGDEITTFGVSSSACSKKRKSQKSRAKKGFKRKRYH